MITQNVWGIATAIIVLAAAPSAVAQENAFTFTCQNIGHGAPEPLGDREGHTISVGDVSCRVDSGPLAGGVMTGRDIWEWDGTNAVSLSNSGVVRKPGTTAVYQESEAKLALIVTDGQTNSKAATVEPLAQIAEAA